MERACPDPDLTTLPPNLHGYTGSIRRTVLPPQGCNYCVWLVEAERGWFVLKTSDSAAKIASLTQEALVLNALAPYRPHIPRFIAREDDLFLFSFLAGTDLATRVASETDPAIRETLMFAQGEFLREVHGWQPEFPHPADWLDHALHRCRAHVSREGYGADEFSIHAGKTNPELVEYLQVNRAGISPRLVWGHGDWCLPNILSDGMRITGAIDWADGGYADYRYDLATGLWTLRRNLTGDPNLPRYMQAFLNGYGYDGDPAELTYFEAIYALY
ncbi:MAG: aminoglycoside 3'-phosphotransferase [Armatimonadaceae bacterium]